jgi:hypothetical protein
MTRAQNDRALELYRAAQRELDLGHKTIRQGLEVLEQPREEEFTRIDGALGSPALVIPRAANRKLAPVDLVDVGGDRKRPIARAPFCSATYMPIAQTCPSSCTFKGRGCFASAGYSGRAVRRLEELARGKTEFELAMAEADAIDRLERRGVVPDGGRDGKSRRDMRLHVSGDITDTLGLDAIAAAVARWQKRGGGSAWSFTHAWRSLPRGRWRTISILASVETAQQVAEARTHSYVPALTIREFPSTKPFKIPGASTTFIPCPAETKGTTCVECRLCLDREPFLFEKDKGIAFAAHGMQVTQAKKRLPMFGTLFGTIP